MMSSGSGFGLSTSKYFPPKPFVLCTALPCSVTVGGVYGFLVCFMAQLPSLSRLYDCNAPPLARGHYAALAAACCGTAHRPFRTANHVSSDNALISSTLFTGLP